MGSDEATTESWVRKPKRGPCAAPLGPCGWSRRRWGAEPTPAALLGSLKLSVVERAYIGQLSNTRRSLVDCTRRTLLPTTAHYRLGAAFYGERPDLFSCDASFLCGVAPWLPPLHPITHSPARVLASEPARRRHHTASTR